MFVTIVYSILDILTYYLSDFLVFVKQFVCLLQSFNVFFKMRKILRRILHKLYLEKYAIYINCWYTHFWKDLKLKTGNYVHFKFPLFYIVNEETYQKMERKNLFVILNFTSFRVVRWDQTLNQCTYFLEISCRQAQKSFFFLETQKFECKSCSATFF